jgi:hypothetical protein
MMVSRGALPPCLWSSLSRSRSRGSKAILLPPSKADPACCDDGIAVGLDVPLPPLLTVLGELREPLDVGPLSSSTDVADEPPPGTLRRDNPPFEVIALTDLWLN